MTNRPVGPFQRDQLRTGAGTESPTGDVHRRAAGRFTEDHDE